MKDTKEITITPPEGYEIDKENSTFEKIVFKKKDEYPYFQKLKCSSGNINQLSYVLYSGFMG